MPNVVPKTPLSNTGWSQHTKPDVLHSHVPVHQCAQLAGHGVTEALGSRSEQAVPSDAEQLGHLQHLANRRILYFPEVLSHVYFKTEVWILEDIWKFKHLTLSTFIKEWNKKKKRVKKDMCLPVALTTSFWTIYTVGKEEVYCWSPRQVPQISDKFS